MTVFHGLFLFLLSGKISVHVLPCFSSAFDIFCHSFPAQHIRIDIRQSHCVLQWFLCYLTDHTVYISYLIIFLLLLLYM